jgi:DNA-directed RNA polymerase specialized sigma24 family protein
MSAEGSVSQWIDQLRAGDHAAAQPLWERYFQRLVGLARKKLQAGQRRAADEEDVALSAFDSFCRGAAHGRFPQLADRNNLWHLLVTITARKALQLVRHDNRQKRGGGAVLGESGVIGPGDSSGGEGGLDRVVGDEPTPEFAAQVAEQCQRMLDRLDKAELRSIALAKMEGYTTEEIAAQMRVAPRTIERKLQVIRTLWEKDMAS